jgi:1,4-dihydroxy-2-naphthoate octaprenyltransferase
MFAKLIAFLRLTRPVFLLGGMLMFALGALVARYEGYPIDGRLYAVGQLFVTSIQLMAHYLNEYWDMEADRLNTARTFFTGGSGVLPEGGLSRETSLTAALVCVAAAGATALMLIFQYRVAPGAWVVLLLGFLGAFYYSSPPVALAGSGYGELTTSLLVAGLVPALGHWLQAGRPNFLLVIATAPLVVLHYAMLIAFELPDFLSDEASGKRTMLVRLGRRRGLSFHNALIGFAFGLVALGPLLSLPIQVAASVIFTIPLAVWQVITMRRLQRGEPMSFNRLTFGAVALFALTAYFIAFSFWVIG